MSAKSDCGYVGIDQSGCEGKGCGTSAHYFTRERNVATAVAAARRSPRLAFGVNKNI